MDDWKYLQKDPSEELSRLYYFSVKKKHPSGEIDVLITVKEFATPGIGKMQFYATADIELNQKTAAFQPVGWSDNLTAALSECLNNIRRFEYQGESTAI
ncbi:MAG TPA: hypothetical protein VMG40_07500 [Bryobacteraceae bacterium]|nr:hypothetical protein [Bryobacteraceae bacterium]